MSMWDKLSDMQSIMKQAAEMGRKLQEIQEQLRRETVEVSVGAGMVKMKMNGRGEVMTVDVDPSLLAASEREMLQELLTSGFNDAARKARELSRSKMAALTGGIDVAGIMGL